LAGGLLGLALTCRRLLGRASIDAALIVYIEQCKQLCLTLPVSNIAAQSEPTLVRGGLPASGQSQLTRGVGVLRDRLVLFLMAMVIVGVGAVMLCWPAHLDAYDRFGFQVACGSGLAADDGQATAARDDAAAEQAPPGEHPRQGETTTDYVERCHSVVRHRRVWAATLMALGATAAVASVWAGRRSRKPASKDAP
jgi:hypothetical protein